MFAITFFLLTGLSVNKSHTHVNTFVNKMKKKMGRPTLSGGAARYCLIAVRVSKDENKAIQAAIKASPLEKTEWLRNALLTAAKGDSITP
jgi:hypothetical protein